MADNNANEYSTVTLSLDDGTECECAIVRIFPAGDNNYIALLPLEGEAASNDEVYLYRYTEKDFLLTATTSQFLKISTLMKNMKSYQMHLTKNLMLWNTKNYMPKKMPKTKNNPTKINLKMQFSYKT